MYNNYIWQQLKAAETKVQFGVIYLVLVCSGFVIVGYVVKRIMNLLFRAGLVCFTMHDTLVVIAPIR